MPEDSKDVIFKTLSMNDDPSRANFRTDRKWDSIRQAHPGLELVGMVELLRAFGKLRFPRTGTKVFGALSGHLCV
jgi:hypothetical protein